MRESALLCYMCVYPDALYFPSREGAPPPSNVKGAIADREHSCTKCGARISEGSGFVYVCGHRPVEGEGALHEELCRPSEA